MDRHVYQPLHPAIRARLDPQYVAFHDAHMQYVEPDDARPWDGTARTKPSLPPGTLDPVPVGATEDLTIADTFALRVFTPAGTPPPAGWPLFVWYHGGGWAIGGIQSENDFCTRVCAGAGVVVCSVGYRLAPEHPFPAAADDADAALAYVTSPAGRGRLGIDVARVAVGGTSAGATLACVAALRQIETAGASSLRLQLLIVPVIDNTAVPETVWAPNAATAPWLTPKRMIWYRDMYLPDRQDWAHRYASPNRAPAEVLAKMPPAWIAVSECDLLAPEGMAYSEQLSSLGVKTELHVLPGCTHSILALNGALSCRVFFFVYANIAGVMDKGKKLVEDAIQKLKETL